MLESRATADSRPVRRQVNTVMLPLVDRKHLETGAILYENLDSLAHMRQPFMIEYDDAA